MELVEKGCTSGKEAEDIVRASLKPLLDEGADRIVLGCTHYPFLSDTIAKVASELVPEITVEIIDPAPAVARHLYETMEQEGIIRKDGFSIELVSSGNPDQLENAYGKLL